MKTAPRPNRAPWLLAIAIGAFALVAAACNGGSEATPTAVVQSSEPTSVGAGGDGGSNADSPSDAEGAGDEAQADDAPDFPTGDAVLVAADYQHPRDFVDNTGAYLPANGKPTVVFVDAIW